VALVSGRQDLGLALLLLLLLPAVVLVSGCLPLDVLLLDVLLLSLRPVKPPSASIPTSAAIP